MENAGGQTKSLEYTCTFCRKSFPTARALGGHQNAHRRERREEKKLFIKDPTEYRKRAFLQSVRAPITTEAPSHPHVYVDLFPIQPQPQVNQTLGRHDWTLVPNPSLDLNQIPQMEVNGNVIDAGMDGNGINYEAMDLNLKL